MDKKTPVIVVILALTFCAVLLFIIPSKIIDRTEIIQKSIVGQDINKTYSINNDNNKIYSIKPIQQIDYSYSHNVYDESTWHQCFKENEINNNVTNAMKKLLNMVERKDIVFYVIGTYKRRPRFFNLANCSFPFNLFLICPDFYHFNEYSFKREHENNCTFGSSCQYYDTRNFYTYIYEIHKSTKWILIFEDDVNFCELTPQYILNIMNLNLLSNINLVHLSRGNVGTIIKTSFIPKFIGLLKEAHIIHEKMKKGWGIDVDLTKLFEEKKNYFDIYYSKYNMMHHPRISLNINAQQHIQNVQGENVVTCDKIGKRWMSKELNYINPYNMEISFEHL